MSRITRLGTIVKVITRYRLDALIDTEKLPLSARLLLKMAKVLPKPKDPRGVRLRKALEDLGPIFIKFGQLLSTRPDLVPADICKELNQLQDNVPPFDPVEFITIVEAALGKPVDELFLKFDHEPLASASVAQIHAAVLQDGREVVVKVIRPGIEKVIEQDIKLLFSVARWVEKHTLDGKRLRPLEIVQDYRHTIFDELNLQREAANASLLRRNFENSPMLYVPEVHWSHTNEKVMVSERIYATPVTDTASLKAQNTDFKVLAERGVEIFFTQVFEHNFFHADMHPGNIFVNASKPKDPQYLAIDCAIMGTLTEMEQYYLARNLLAIFRRDYRQIAELHVKSNWVPSDTSISDFTAAIRTVCEPIFERPFSEISFAQLLISLFRTARRFNMEVQPSLVLLQKTLLNIEGLGRQLYPDLDLWTTAQPFLERWLKNRFKPDALMEQLKRYGPDWLEQFPQMPQKILDFLEQSPQFVQPRQPVPVVVEKTRPKSLLPALLGAACLGAALGLAFPNLVDNLQQLPESSLVLGAIGVLLLLMRR